MTTGRRCRGAESFRVIARINSAATYLLSFEIGLRARRTPAHARNTRRITNILRALEVRASCSSGVSRHPNETGHRPLAPHFRLLELGGGNRPVEGGAQLAGRLQRQLNPGPRPGLEAGVDEVERDDVAQRRMARMVIGNHRLRE